jgi:hypothetical protein
LDETRIHQNEPAAMVNGGGGAAEVAQDPGIETDLLRRPPGTPIYDAIHKLSVDQGEQLVRHDAGRSAPA